MLRAIAIVVAFSSPGVLFSAEQGAANTKEIGAKSGDKDSKFIALFPEDGVPKGWTVRQWNDVSKPAEQGGEWKVKDGVLHGPAERGNWLMSEKEYSDFELQFEFKLGERGNGGCALRICTGTPSRLNS